MAVAEYSTAFALFFEEKNEERKKNIHLVLKGRGKNENTSSRIVLLEIRQLIPWFPSRYRYRRPPCHGQSGTAARVSHFCS